MAEAASAPMIRPEGSEDARQVIIDARFKHGIAPQEVLFSDLDIYERMAIVAITYHGEVAFPSLERLARLMGCSRSTAHAALKRLRQKGWLEITARWGADGSRTSNRYHLRYPPSVSRTGSSVSRTGPVSLPDPKSSQSSSQNLREEQEEKNGAPAAGAPVLPRVPDSGQRQGTEDRRESVNRLLARWAEVCQQRIHRVPPAYPGRDRKIMANLLRDYGEPEAARVVTEFVRYRAREGRVVSLPALQSAAEGVRQHLPKLQPRPTQPGNDLGLRKWTEYLRQLKAGGPASPDSGAGAVGEGGAG